MTQDRKTGRIKSAHVISVLLAVVAFLWVASGMLGQEKQPVPGTLAVAPTTVPVEFPMVRVRQSVAQYHLREVSLFGRTEAIHKAEVAAETAGRIVRMSVEKGDSVKKGDILLQLDIDDRRAKLEEAKAQVDYQEIAYNAAKKLSNKQFQSRIKLAESLASLETAKANLKMIRLEIERTVVRAPISGIVNGLGLSVGDYVKIGDIVASIINLDPIRIVGQLSEREVSRVKRGEVASARLPSGQVVSGIVQYISRAGLDKTRTFRVDIWIDNADGAIPEGLTAELDLPAEQTRAHLVSPAILTLNDRGQIGVKAVDAQDIVRFFPVTIITDTTDGIWLGGLPDQIKLITVGQEFVRIGNRVRSSVADSPTSPKRVPATGGAAS